MCGLVVAEVVNYTVTWNESQWVLWTAGILGTAATGIKSLISLVGCFTLRHLGANQGTDRSVGSPTNVDIP